MSIYVGWDSPEQTIIRWEVEGRWDWDEFEAAQQQSVALIQTVPHVVHIIADVSNSAKLPSNALASFRSYRHSGLNNVGQVALVQASPLIRAAAKVIEKIAPQAVSRFHFVNTLDEAREILSKQAVRSIK
jgi:hypothetical protein